MNIPTPKYNLSTFPNVYEPSEDTFLFLDALSIEQQNILDLNPTFAVEIGSGSGIVITALSAILNNTCCCLATDINPDCCRATLQTSRMNKTRVESVNMDLLGFFKNKFDVILFNPPYVVTDRREVGVNDISAAYAGGERGREVIDRFFEVMGDFLSDKGVCYMVLLRENNLSEVVRNVEGRGFKWKKVIERRVPGEYLYVYKFYK